ncbi:hypothetical protein NDU88_003626 [Pleurodeles waltl]|uniref:Uncharacterized protein n=1 Tax=Pleurodeles waltl TaxID=8319 RepID=A0AAV7QA74_PLEWA|nr:hypothetical protein NDU88_003626 [Pleurodeles waltl]
MTGILRVIAQSCSSRSDVDPNRTPSTVRMARCMYLGCLRPPASVNGCYTEDHSLVSVLVNRAITVKYRVPLRKCSTKNKPSPCNGSDSAFCLEERKLVVSVACTCAVPQYVK